MENLDEMWEYLTEYGIATDDEVRLITNINGYTIEALNSIIYARTGYHDMEQLQWETRA